MTKVRSDYEGAYNEAPAFEERKYITPEQTEARYGLTDRFIKSLRQRRLIRFCRAGHRTILIDRESLERYLRKRTSPAIGEAT